MTTCEKWDTWRFVIDIPVTECGKRREINQELRTEIKKKGDFWEQVEER